LLSFYGVSLVLLLHEKVLTRNPPLYIVRNTSFKTSGLSLKEWQTSKPAEYMKGNSRESKSKQYWKTCGQIRSSISIIFHIYEGYLVYTFNLKLHKITDPFFFFIFYSASYFSLSSSSSNFPTHGCCLNGFLFFYVTPQEMQTNTYYTTSIFH